MPLSKVPSSTPGLVEPSEAEVQPASVPVSAPGLVRRLVVIWALAAAPRLSRAAQRASRVTGESGREGSRFDMVEVPFQTAALGWLVVDLPRAGGMFSFYRGNVSGA